MYIYTTTLAWYWFSPGMTGEDLGGGPRNLGKGPERRILPRPRYPGDRVKVL